MDAAGVDPLCVVGLLSQGYRGFLQRGRRGGSGQVSRPICGQRHRESSEQARPSRPGRRAPGTGTRNEGDSTRNPTLYGDGTTGLPPTDKHYWPVYLKCQELGVAVAIQVGHTGPLLPSECGRPIYLDEVALAFPELTILGCHLGQPWHEEMMTLAWKHPNVYVETSARTPKHWPASFVDFARGWGKKKIIWATDYPLLSFERTLAELEQLDLTSEIFRNIVRDNLVRALKLEAS